MLIYVGGVPGVGKTSIISSAVQFGQCQSLRIQRIIGTDIMCELAKVESVAELRRLPEEIRAGLRREMNRRIYEVDRGDPTLIRICDGHFCYPDIKGEKIGIRSVQEWDAVQMKGMIVVVAKPETISERARLCREERPDRILDEQFIKNLQILEVATAQEQASKIGVPLRIFANGKNDVLSQQAEKLISIVRDLVDVGMS